MKKIISLFLVILTITLLVIPVSAASILSYPSHWYDNVEYDYPYAIIIMDTNTGAYTLYASRMRPVYYTSANYVYLNNGFAYSYYTSNGWDGFILNPSSSTSISLNGNKLVWCSDTVKTDTGGAYMYNDPNFFDDAPTFDDSEDGVDTGFLGGFFNSIAEKFEWLGNTFKSYINLLINEVAVLPSKISNALKDSFSDVKGAITSIPDLVVDRFKDFMLPDAEALQETLNDFSDQLREKFNIDTSVFENLFKSETPVEDIYFDYSIPGVGDFEFKALDSSFLVQGVDYFRPIIRGFLVLMLFLYHIRQLIGFFGYDAGVVAGRSEHVKSMKEQQED